jgi:hypothetical protein
MVALNRDQPERNAYERMFDVIYSCDLAAIVRQFHRDMSLIEQEVLMNRVEIDDPDGPDYHPLTVVYAQRIASLAGLEIDRSSLWYRRALNTCHMRVGSDYMVPREPSLDDLFRETDNLFRKGKRHDESDSDSASE